MPKNLLRKIAKEALKSMKSLLRNAEEPALVTVFLRSFPQDSWSPVAVLSAVGAKKKVYVLYLTNCLLFRTFTVIYLYFRRT